MNQNKATIINQYKIHLEIVQQLIIVPEELWRMPIEKEKWSIAEIIGHFIPWDEFIIQYRIPYFFHVVSMPKAPEVTKLNEQSSKKSKNSSKLEIINEFSIVRGRLIDAILGLEDNLWRQSYYIGKSELTLYHYFSGLLEHDKHHFRQIKQIWSTI